MPEYGPKQVPVVCPPIGTFTGKIAHLSVRNTVQVGGPTAGQVWKIDGCYFNFSAEGGNVTTPEIKSVRQSLGLTMTVGSLVCAEQIFQEARAHEETGTLIAIGNLEAFRVPIVYPGEVVEITYQLETGASEAVIGMNSAGSVVFSYTLVTPERKPRRYLG